MFVEKPAEDNDSGEEDSDDEEGEQGGQSEPYQVPTKVSRTLLTIQSNFDPGLSP